MPDLSDSPDDRSRVDTNASGTSSEGSLSNISRVIQGLAEKPEFLLIFGIALLFFGGGSFTAVVGAAVNNSLAIWFGFGFAVLSLVAAVFVIKIVHPKERYIENQKRRIQDAVEEALAQRGQKQSGDDRIELGISDKDIEEVLISIVYGVRKAIDVTNKAFDARIKKELEKVRHATLYWQDEQLVIKEDSEEFLLNLYRSAKDNVFSTCITDFFEHWHHEFGNDILESHDLSPAEVTRVFIFNSWNEISIDDIAELERHASFNINVYVSILEMYTDSISKDLIKDFTIVDDREAIGITQNFGTGNNSATWYFNNEKKYFEMNKAKRVLLRKSMTLHKFLSEIEKE